MDASGFKQEISNGLGKIKKATLMIRATPADGTLLGSAANLAAAALKKSAEPQLAAAQASGQGAGSSTNQGTQEKTLEVQYNPASLTIQANAQAVPFAALLKNMDAGVVNQQMRPPAIVLNVELTFDDTNVKDAFMADKIRMSAGDVVTDVSAIVKAATGKTYSVQNQTNGLVAMLMRDDTRLVTFRWADMSFSGVVSQVQARYTLFSVSGRPIRSQVSLQIAQQITAKADAISWNKAFDACFKTDEAGSGGEKSKTQKVANILNINGV